MATANTEIEKSAEHRANVDDDGAQDAFDNSFDSTDGAPPPAASPTGKTTAPAAPAPAAGAKPSPAAPKPESEPPADAHVDPYAGLSKEVKEGLAQVPALKHAFDSLNGRFVALERQLKELSTPAPAGANGASKPAPASKAARVKREAIRGELHEVAEAMDELEEAIASHAPPAPAPAPAAAPASDENEESPAFKALTAVDKDWQSKLRGTDFALWLTQQDQAYANTVRTTGEAAVIAQALTRFDQFQARVKAQTDAREAERQRVEGERNNRVTAAAQRPRGNARPPAAPPGDDVEAAFETGYEKGAVG